MKRLLKVISVLCSILVLVSPILAAGETPRVINFEKHIPHTQNQNWMIAQSSEGFLYFANSSGILEFDGVRSTLHPLPERQIIRSIACDAQDRIFTGAFAEFGYWQRQEGGQLTYHSLSSAIQNDKFANEEIWHIIVKQDYILFQSFSALYKYDYEKIIQLDPPGNIMFMQAVGERIILPVIGQGLYEIEETGSFTFLEGSEFLGHTKVRTILPFQEDFIIGTDQLGIFQYKDRQFRVWENPINETLKKHQLNRAVKLSNGWLAFGTILNGIYLLNADGQLRFHLEQENGLQNNTVLSLFEDRNHNLWAGLDKGIDLLIVSDPLSFFKDKSGKTGTIYTATIHQGNLYLGTNQGVFMKSWADRYLHTFELVEGTQGQVWELQVFDKQLFCGHNEGTFIIEGNKVRSISSITGGWSTIRHPSMPDLLIQGTYTGVVIFKKTINQEWQFSHRLEGFLDPVRKIMMDKSGHLWVVHPYRGLYRLSPDKNLKKITELRSFSKDDGLPTEFRIGLQQINEELIVKADNQFLKWDTPQNKMVSFTNIHGRQLPNDRCDVIYGREKNWFLSYSQEVQWFRDSALLAVFPIELVPGYSNIIPLDTAMYLFCLNNGYALLDQAAIPSTKLAPPPLITNVQVRDKEVLSLALKGPIILEPGRKNMYFQFTVPHFTESFRFRYKLEGFEAEWSEWSSRSYAEFTNLLSGSYKFSVQSDLTPDIISLEFHIKPQWYETNLARFFYGLAFLGLLLLLFRWHQYRLKRQWRQLDIQKERQLHQQRIEARNEQLKADVVSKSRELAGSTFNLIRKNEILLQVKEELQTVKEKPGVTLPNQYYKRIVKLVDNHLSSEHDWEIFETNFNQVHEAFFKKLKIEYSDLTPGDLQLAAYLKMNLSTKEIAPLLNISIRGVENKRYRLRKKVGLPPDANLTEFMIEF